MSPSMANLLGRVQELLTGQPSGGRRDVGVPAAPSRRGATRPIPADTTGFEYMRADAARRFTGVEQMLSYLMIEHSNRMGEETVRARITGHTMIARHGEGCPDNMVSAMMNNALRGGGGFMQYKVDVDVVDGHFELTSHGDGSSGRNTGWAVIEGRTLAGNRRADDRRQNFTMSQGVVRVFVEPPGHVRGRPYECVGSSPPRGADAPRAL